MQRDNICHIFLSLGILRVCYVNVYYCAFNDLQLVWDICGEIAGFMIRSIEVGHYSEIGCNFDT